MEYTVTVIHNDGGELETIENVNHIEITEDEIYIECELSMNVQQTFSQNIDKLNFSSIVIRKD